MRRRAGACVALAGCVVLAGAAGAQGTARTPAPSDARLTSERLAKSLLLADTRVVSELLAPELSPPTAEELRTLRAEIVAAEGPLRFVLAATEPAGSSNGAITVFVPLRFERGERAFRFEFDRLDPGPGSLRSWRLETATPTPAPTPIPSPADAPAPYANTAAIRERRFELNPGEWALPAVYTTPRRASASDRVPAVIVLGGRWQRDTDGRQGTAAPLRDISQGLATAGAASLRFVRRGVVHASRFDSADLTFEDEYVADSLAAIDFLKAQPEVDPNRIYLLGVGIGATAAPMVAARSADVRGLVLAAPPANPGLAAEIAWREGLHDRLLGDFAAEAQALRSARERLLAGTLFAEELTLGYGTGYWRRMEDFGAIESLARFSGPALLAFPESDVLTSAEDVNAWRAGLRQNPAVRMQRYPATGPLMLSEPGPDADLAAARHVSAAFLADVAAFVGARQPAAPDDTGDDPTGVLLSTIEVPAP